MVDLPVHLLTDILCELLHQRKTSQAITLANSILASNKPDPIVLYLKGIAVALTDERDEGTRNIREALSQDAKWPDSAQDFEPALDDPDKLKALLFPFRGDGLNDAATAEIHSVISRILEQSGDIGGCIENLERAVELDGMRHLDKLKLAITLASNWEKQFSVMARVESLLRELYEVAPDHVDVCEGLARCLAVQARSDEAEEFFEKCCRLDPTVYRYHVMLVDLLYEDGKLDELLKATRRGLEHFPEDEKFLQMLAMATETSSDKNKVKMVRWPQKIEEMADIDQAVGKFLFNFSVDPKHKIGPTDKILTLGSCFADNIARALRENGMDAFNITFDERINSTYSNLAYLERVAGGEKTPNGKVVATILGRDPIQDRDRFSDAKMVVFTLGVAPNFFSKETGEMVLLKPGEFKLSDVGKKYIWRNTTVEENKNNIKRILEILRSFNESLTIILTVSPIPLKVTFDYSSAMVADCVSKSTLRATVDEIMREVPGDMIYWPSFEVFRWMGAYSGPMYGAEDQSTYHASEFVLDSVFRHFYRIFLKEDHSTDMSNLTNIIGESSEAAFGKPGV